MSIAALAPVFFDDYDDDYDDDDIRSHMHPHSLSSRIRSCPNRQMAIGMSVDVRCPWVRPCQEGGMLYCW